MSHVADGDLHAYLDGALEFYAPRQAKRIREHLERCTVCRHRLDEEAQLAGTARSVLADASPETLPVPPLEELRRRAELGAVAEKTAPSSTAHVRWAWAATIVLALGIGWGVGAWPSGARREAAVPPEPAAQRGEVGPGAAAQSDSPPPEATTAPDAAVPELEAPARSDATAAPRLAESTPAAAVKPSADAVAPAPAAEERSTALAGLSIAERSVPELSPAPPAVDAGGRLPALADAPAPGRLALEEVVVTGETQRSTTGAAARRSEQPALERPLVAQNRTVPGPMGDLRLAGPRPQSAAPTRGIEAQRDAYDEAPPRAPLTLDGLTVLRVARADVGDEPAILVRQETSDGDFVDLYFIGVPEGGVADVARAERSRESRAAAGVSTQAAAPPPAAPAAPPMSVLAMRPPIGARRVIGAFGGGWVVAYTTMSETALRDLLQAGGVVLLP
jgi:hypothetical protein